MQPKQKVYCINVIVFCDMITDAISNKKLSPIVTKLFIRERKLNICTVFIIKSYLKVPKDVSFNKSYLIIHQMLILKTKNLYKKCSAKPYSFLVFNTTIASDNPLRFRKNLLEII